METVIKSGNLVNGQEQQYSLLLEASMDAFLEVDLRGQILHVNPAACKLSGYSKEELTRMSMRDLETGLLSGLFADPVKNPRSHHTVRYETKIRCRDGHGVDVEISAQWLPQSPEKIFCFMRDVTNRELARRAIRSTEHKFTTVFRTAPVLITIVDFVTSQYVDVNDRFLQVSGFTREELIGHTPVEVGWISRENFEYLQDLFKENPRVQDIELTMTTRTGQPIHNLYNGAMIEMDGRPCLLSISLDITERKNSVKALRHMSDLMQYIIEHNRSAIAVHDRDLRYIYVSQRYLLDYKVKENDVVGKHHYDVFPDLPQKWRDVHQRALKGEVLSAEDDPFERADGTVEWTRWECRPWYDADGNIGGIIVYTEVITDRKKTELELIATKEKAEENNRLKTAFLNNMSHEIRTPMNAIIGFADLMTSAEGEEKDHYSEIIRRSSKQLLSVIDDVIQLSRLQSEKIPVNSEIFRPSDLIRALYQGYNYPENLHGIELRVSTPDAYNDLSIPSDRDKVHQVMIHLLSNALKYTTVGTISIGFRVEPGQVVFFVEDTGIGIPDSEKTKLFETFYRGKQVTSNAIGGTGLGLNIAKELVGLLGGTISFESEVGTGSRFYFNIPFEQSFPMISEIAEIRPVPKLLSELVVLIAEDNYENYLYLDVLLRKKVKRIDRVVTGVAAVEAIANRSYDLVLMDIKMPDMDGLEATRIIKKQSPQLPVIAQTAYAQPEEKANALKVGFDDYLAKPIKKEVLMEIINRYGV